MIVISILLLYLILLQVYLQLISICFNYENNINCTSTLSIQSVDSSHNIILNDFILSYDIRSVIIAIAVNNRLDFSFNLYKLLNGLEYIEYDIYTTYELAYYFDRRYPGMDPIVCLNNISNTNNNNTNVNNFCLVHISRDVLAYPILDSYSNSNNNIPNRCTCANANTNTALCNQFNFLTGFILFPASVTTHDVIMNMIYFISKYIPNGLITQYQIISSLAYPALYSTATINDPLSNRNYFQNKQRRNNYYNFCNGLYSNCSIISVHSSDSNRLIINSYMKELHNGSCTDTITIPNFISLANIPPLQLTEAYYECASTYISAFINALGIASGTVSIFIPLVVIIMLLCPLIIAVCKGKQVEVQKYGKDERSTMLDILALQLLLIRDDEINSSTTCNHPDDINPSTSSSSSSPTSTSLLPQLLLDMKLNTCNSDKIVSKYAKLNGIPEIKKTLGIYSLTKRPSLLNRISSHTNISLSSRSINKRKSVNNNNNNNNNNNKNNIHISNSKHSHKHSGSGSVMMIQNDTNDSNTNIMNEADIELGELGEISEGTDNSNTNHTISTNMNKYNHRHAAHPSHHHYTHTHVQSPYPPNALYTIPLTSTSTSTTSTSTIMNNHEYPKSYRLECTGCVSTYMIIHIQPITRNTILVQLPNITFTCINTTCMNLSALPDIYKPTNTHMTPIILLKNKVDYQTGCVSLDMEGKITIHPLEKLEFERNHVYTIYGCSIIISLS